ncbi:hypothetical protein VP249E411_P0199 [Vibrio phage 249E41-1]|nr:hypothetical protein VP249E411_P0199 [Vibrio phage 249E41-1]
MTWNIFVNVKKQSSKFNFISQRITVVRGSRDVV